MPLTGAYNIRDIGGYPTTDGAVVRRGLVYRGDALDRLTDGDRALLAGLGVRTVFDFRRATERERAPSRLWEPPPRVVLLDVPEGGDERDIIAWLATEGRDGFRAEIMAGDYAVVLEEYGPRFRQLIEALADDATGVALYHCTAGKDRTGIATALLLGLLGVDAETIVEDYHRTHEHRSVHRIAQMRPELEAAGLDPEAVAPWLSAPPEVMRLTLAHLDRAHGGVVGYVRDLGVTDEVIDALRHRLRERRA